MAAAINNVQNCNKCFVNFKQSDTIIKCSGICEQIVHKHCTNLGRNESKILPECPNLRWFCDQCVKNTSILSAVFQNLDKKLNELLETVSTQSTLIKEQGTRIHTLEKSLSIYQNQENKNICNNITKTKTTKSPPSTTATLTGTQQIEESRLNPSVIKINRKRETNSNNLSNKGAGKTEAINKSHRECSHQQHKKSGRPKQQRYIRGSNVEKTSLKAVEKHAWIYVTRLDRNTSQDDIISHLSQICKIECTKLEQKNSDRVASFRIRAPFDKKDEIMDGNIWPNGTWINRFYFPSNKTKPQDLRNYGTGVSDNEDDFLNRTMIEIPST